MASRLLKDVGDMLLVALIRETGSIKEASAVAGLSRTVVGRRLAALEHRLGIALFDRSGHRIRLTTAGEGLSRSCLRLRTLVDHLESFTASRDSQPRIVTISATFDEAGQLLGPVYADANFGDQLQVSLLFPGPDSIDRAPGDLKFEIGPIRREGYVIEKVADLPCSIWARPDLPGWLPHEPSRETMVRVPSIGIVDRSDGVETWVLRKNDALRKLRVTSNFRLTDSCACRDAAAEGIGVALLPDYLCASAAKRGQLVRIWPEWKPLTVPLYATYRRGATIDADARRIIDYAKTRLAKQHSLNHVEAAA